MKFKFVIILLFFFHAFHLYSQIDDITFRRVSPPGGFCFRSVHIISKDLFGYIWMGTHDGIFRYDSKEIKQYIHDSENKNGLPSNNITGIKIDNNNNIWVSTNSGLCKFNRNSQEFERVNYTYENGETPEANINSISIDDSGNLWIADRSFFGYFDKKNYQLVRITEGLNDIPGLLYTDLVNRIWLGTSGGAVYLVLPDEKKVVKKIDGPGSTCQTIFANYNEIWVGYRSHGARLYDLDGNLKLTYSYATDNEELLSNDFVRKIWKDTHQRLWIAAYHGLFVDDGKKLIRFDPNDFSGLPHNSIYEIFEDDQGGIWFGTWSGGVAYLHLADNKFNNYRFSKAPGSLSNNMVSSFAQTVNGDVFIGTEVGGLNKFDVKTNQFQHIQVRETGKIFNIKALCADKSGGLWIGTAFRGLWYRAPGTNKITHFEKGPNDGQHVSDDGIYAMCLTDSGIWIGTNPFPSPGGLCFYNSNTKKISFDSDKPPFSYFINQSIRSLTIDSKDNLWVGTLNGLNKVHIPTGRITTFSPNPNSSFKTKSAAFFFVKELSDGKIWIGTNGDGAYIYNQQTDSLSFFDADGLLKEKDVYGIIEGDTTNIWITSNDGLILYNKQKKSSRKFIMIDGIQGNLFNPNAIFKDKDDNLYFGGTNGFSVLQPNKIKTNNWPPNVLISSIALNNRDIIPFQIDINKYSEIVFSPNETTLKFNFSADNYLLPEKNKFKYRLTNYSNQWILEENYGTATFVNVPAGKYIFEVKACNNDGEWNEIPATLPIVIKQFWYKSRVAISLYLIALLAFSIVLFRFYFERIKLRKTILLEKIERENEEQLHEMKLRFFTNISHEFRTPLTLINWPVKKLLESKNLTTEQQGLLETVKRNTNRLLQLINQIMELRKADKEQTKLTISRFDLVHFVNERILNFSEEARSRNIQFTFTHERQEFIIEADEEKLDKIIYNLLSNAFKFTQDDGKISVIIQGNQIQKSNYFSNQLIFGRLENEDFVEIIVIDNGKGIDSEDLPNIFERFEKGKNEKLNELSTGIGLNLCKEFTLMHHGVIIVQSTPGRGSRFSIRIPTNQKMHKIFYNSHEKVKNLNSWESQKNTDLTAADKNNHVKLLIVEDNEDLRNLIVKLLENYYSLLSAENGKQGLEILKMQNVQLVISDIMMPVMDGFEFCQIIKSQIETSHIPVILLTALSSSENMSTGLECGADAYISKPFDENVLLSQIKNLLLQRKRLQENYIQRFISKQPIDIGSLDNYFLNKVNAIIEENIENEEFSVEKLAENIGLSRSQLHRKLKQISNSTASEYILLVKIKKATELLLSGRYNIDEVAFKTGFNSHSYFTKCFKKVHNISPKEFLKNL